MLRVLLFLASLSFVAASTCTEKYPDPAFSKGCEECEKWHKGKAVECMECGNKCYAICEADKPNCYKPGSKYLTCHTDCMKKHYEAEPLDQVAAPAHQMVCVLDGSEMVADGISSALSIWAATERCHGAWLEQSPVKCTIDVTGAIQSLTAMSAAIAKMVDKCDGIDRVNHKCAWAANAVVSATAGLAKASAFIADKCAHVAKAPYAHDMLDTLTQLGKCTVNAGAGMNTLFEASNTMRSLKHKCNANAHSKACTGEGEEAVYVLSQLGAYISYSVGECGTYHAATTHTQFDAADAMCSGAVFDAIAQLHRIAEVGTNMMNQCKSSSSLYLDTDEVAPATGTPLLTTLLAALLPVTGVVAFVAGSRFAKSARQGGGYHDPELLVGGHE